MDRQKNDKRETVRATPTPLPAPRERRPYRRPVVKSGERLERTLMQGSCGSGPDDCGGAAVG